MDLKAFEEEVTALAAQVEHSMAQHQFLAGLFAGKKQFLESLKKGVETVGAVAKDVEAVAAAIEPAPADVSSANVEPTSAA